MEIKYNKIGEIIEGDNVGWYVKIINDKEKSGGFFVLEFESKNSDKGYDTWLETENDVKGYFYESEWKINWGLD